MGCAWLPKKRPVFVEANKEEPAGNAVTTPPNANKKDETKRLNVKVMSNCDVFKRWKLGSINIRSVKEKSEGAKIYCITKQVARAGLSVCLLQEVRYRNKGSE